MDGLGRDVIATPSTRVQDMGRAMIRTARVYATQGRSYRLHKNLRRVFSKEDGVNNVPITGFRKENARVSVTPTPRMTVPYTCFHLVKAGLDVGDTVHVPGTAKKLAVSVKAIRTPMSIVPNACHRIIPSMTG